MTRHLVLRSWSVALPALALALAVLATGGDGQKQGVCPPASNVGGVCNFFCFYDNECPGAQRCCRTACGGSACLEPVSVPYPRPQPSGGMCPAKETTKWVCSNRCSEDYDCPPGYKCCQSRCGGYACMKAVTPF